MTFDLTQLAGLGGIPLVAALVQLVKGALPDLDPRYWPTISLLAGIGWNLGLAVMLGGDLRTATLIGFITGMSASGLYTWVRLRPAPPESPSSSPTGFPRPF